MVEIIYLTLYLCSLVVLVKHKEKFEELIWGFILLTFGFGLAAYLLHAVGWV